MEKTMQKLIKGKTYKKMNTPAGKINFPFNVKNAVFVEELSNGYLRFVGDGKDFMMINDHEFQEVDISLKLNLKGYLQALEDYAWWKEGKQYIGQQRPDGTGSYELKEVINKTLDKFEKKQLFIEQFSEESQQNG